MPTINEQNLAVTVGNTSRDEGTTGKNQNQTDANAGYADADQPVQRPPEGIPEPRPVEPTLSTPNRTR